MCTKENNNIQLQINDKELYLGAIVRQVIKFKMYLREDWHVKFFLL